MAMTLASLVDLAALLQEHPQTPLELYRSLIRTHQHQKRAGIKPLFPINDLGRLLGLDEEVMRHEQEIAISVVGRAHRASIKGDRRDDRGHRYKTQRYVTEDGRLVTF